MKKQMLYFIAMSMMIFLFSCTAGGHKKDITSTDPVKEKLIHINLPATGEKKLNVSEFADTVLYIPLETNSKSLLGKIRQIEITDNHIAINGADRLLLFSKEGKFITQIGKKGKGPGEYTSIFDFALYKDTIYLTSTGKKQVIKYSINGDFIEEVSLPSQFYMSWFDITPEKCFVSYSMLRSGQLILFDKNLSKIDTLRLDFNVPKNSTPNMIYSMLDPYDQMFEFGSKRKFLFTSYMSDTIWNISEGKKKLAYVLNLKDKILPAEYRIERLNGDTKRFMQVAAPYQKIKLIETPSYLLLFQKSWTASYINTTYIYDVEKKTTIKYETPYIFDDLVGMQNLVPLYSSNDHIIAILNPTELKEVLKSASSKAPGYESFPTFAWIEKMKKVKEDDNQILVIMPIRNK